MLQHKPGAGHVQEGTCFHELLFHPFKGVQTGLGELFRQKFCFLVQCLLLLIQLLQRLVCTLNMFQFLAGFLCHVQKFLHRVGPVFVFQPVDGIQPLFQLVQFGRIKTVIIQPGGQIHSKLPGIVIQIRQSFLQRLQRLIQNGSLLQRTICAAQQVGSAGKLISAGKRTVSRSNLLQNGLCVGNNLTAGNQPFFLANLQSSIFNFIQLKTQKFHLSLFFSFI